MQRWNLEWETGIYPGEMVAFLALCDLVGAASIIESGRGQHAYSTRVLGEYSERTGAQVVSIDMESDPVRGAECRRMLARYRRVTCLVGDAFDAIPAAAATLPGPIAVLLDGPKEFAANRLSLLATVLFPIAAIAHHNSDPGLKWTDEFGRFFPGAFHYESLYRPDVAEWNAFKRWERETVNGYELPGLPGRSLVQSSLVLATVAATPRPISVLLALDGVRTRASAFSTLLKWQRRCALTMRGGSRSVIVGTPGPGDTA